MVNVAVPAESRAVPAEINDRRKVRLNAMKFVIRISFQIASSNNWRRERDFEPAIRFPAYTLSRRAPSTTRPPLRSFARADGGRPPFARPAGPVSPSPSMRRIANRRTIMRREPSASGQREIARIAAARSVGILIGFTYGRRPHSNG